MKVKTIKTIFIIIVFIAITIRANYLFTNTFSPSFDVVSTATNIVDGDTFDIASGDTIRLADVDTPEYYESGYNEASNFLSELIYNKRVYLDARAQLGFIVLKYTPVGVALTISSNI